MKFFASPDRRVHFEEIPPLLAGWIEKIPEFIDAWTQSEDAEARLFPLPAAGAGTEALNEDWKAHVQPELHDWFRSAQSIVREDARNMKHGETDCSLIIPLAHIDAWLNALNQARLVLAEIHQLTEKDLDAQEPGGKDERKTLAIMQVGFYGLLQECLVAQMDSDNTTPE